MSKTDTPVELHARVRDLPPEAWARFLDDVEVYGLPTALAVQDAMASLEDKDDAPEPTGWEV